MAVNQYKKEGNSPNDYKKGNRTDSKRNTDTIQAYNRQFKEELDGYKEFARKRREYKTARQEECGEYYKRLVTYIEECKDKEEPITRADIILRMGIGKDTYYNMKNGNLDYRLIEYIDTHNISEADIYINRDSLPVTMIDNREILLIPFSELIEKGELLLEAEAERRLYTSSKVGDIFTLKALHGWRDDSGTAQHIGTVNQLVIASESEARRAIELLK